MSDSVRKRLNGCIVLRCRCNEPALLIHQARDRPAPLLDSVGNLVDLLLAMGAGVLGIGHEVFDLAPLDLIGGPGAFYRREFRSESTADFVGMRSPAGAVDRTVAYCSTDASRAVLLSASPPAGPSSRMTRYAGV
jgi:hypothetical protein